MESVDPEFADSPNDTGGIDDTLRPMEALDADDVRNDDGDEVVDPPDGWAAADHVADEKLAAEEPERSDEGEAPAATDDDTGLLSDDELDRVDPEDHGRDKGQIGGSPDDGDSLFPVVE